MQENTENYKELKDFLNCEDLKHILICALTQWNLARLVNKFKLNQKDIKTTKVPAKNLAGILAEKAFADPAIFKELAETLDLYSVEARDAVKDSVRLTKYNDIIDGEKGRRKKIMIARLSWALLNEPSTKRKVEGKVLIEGLADQKRTIPAKKPDREDGEKRINAQSIKHSIAEVDKKAEINRGKNYRGKHNKRREGQDSKKTEQNKARELYDQKPQNGDSEQINRAAISKLKQEAHLLKRENIKLLHQIKSNNKAASSIKELEKRFRKLDKEHRDTLARIEKEFVARERFDSIKKEYDALRKEKERLYRLIKTSDKLITQIENDHKQPSFLRTIFRKITPSSCYRFIAKKGGNCRVGVFVDVQNMFYSAKNLYHGRLDFEKFLNIAVHGRKLIKAIAYIVKTPEIDQSKFINLLKNNDYEVKTIDLKTGMNGFAKGNWDVGMVMDIFELSDKLDVIVLASGDGDFVPLVKHLKKRGIRVEVFGFTYNTAIDLKDCADQFYPLQEDILIKDQRGNVKQH